MPLAYQYSMKSCITMRLSGKSRKNSLAGPKIALEKKRNGADLGCLWWLGDRASVIVSIEGKEVVLFDTKQWWRRDTQTSFFLFYWKIKISLFCLMLLPSWQYNFCHFIPLLNHTDVIASICPASIHNPSLSPYTHTELLLGIPGIGSLVLMSKSWELPQGTPLLSSVGMSASASSLIDKPFMC